MDVTSQLLKVFEVEKQLRGLQSKLKGAEKFLAGQDKELKALDDQKASLEGQIKQLAASSHNQGVEVARLEEKMATVRSRMDNATSNKEYKAFLTELNTYKADKEKLESASLEQMQKLDDLKKQLEGVVTQRAEREKLRGVAAGERNARHSEVADRVKELETQRDTLSKDVPEEVLRDFRRLLEQRGEDAMGPVEVVDVKRGEFHCGVCMMALPVDTVVSLVKGGKLTKCSSCQCVLYMEAESVKALQPASSRR